MLDFLVPWAFPVTHSALQCSPPHTPEECRALYIVSKNSTTELHCQPLEFWQAHFLGIPCYSREIWCPTDILVTLRNWSRQDLPLSPLSLQALCELGLE